MVLYFQIIAILFFLGIMLSKGTNRLKWFFIGIIFFPSGVIIFNIPSLGGMPFPRLLVYTLLLSELLFDRYFIKKFKQNPFYKLLFIIFLGLLTIGILDDRLNVLQKFMRPAYEFIEKYLIIYLCYKSIDSSNGFNKIKKLLIISSAVLCIYGIYNYITHSNPYYSIIESTFGTPSFFDIYLQRDTRFRVNSFVNHPIFYGYLLDLLFIIVLSDFIQNKKKYNIVIMLFIFVNVLLTNSRTPIVVLFIGIIVLILNSLKGGQVLRYALTIILIGLILLNIPFVQEKINSVIDIVITGGTKTRGSSIEGRFVQLAASYSEFLKSPIHGNGLRYINENMGFSGTKGLKYFGGFESYIFVVLIQEGLIGIVISLSFFSYTIWYFFSKKDSLSKKPAALGLSIIIMFLVFIVGTSALDSWKITMGIIGVLIKAVELSYKNNIDA